MQIIINLYSRELTVFESTSKMAVQRKKQPSQTLDEMMKLFGGLSEADLWNNRLRDVTLALAGRIPKVGAVIKALIGHFWPPNKEDIWSLIKDQVQELVDSRILQHELEEREAEIRGLHATMVYYVEAKDIEKGILMGAMVAKSLELFEKFTRSSNRKQLIPLTITHSYLHLGILKERLLSGTRIFGEDNSEVWQWNLETTVEEYERFFAVVYLEWKEWRDSKIEAKWGTTKKPTTIPPFFLWHCHGDVIDHFTGASASYADSLCNIPKRFQNVCERIEQKMVSEADSEMMEVYSRTFYLENFIPGKECNPPKVDPNLKINIVAVGPYSVATADVSHPPSDAKIGSSKPVADKPGIITSILVREYNSIDAMQLTYSDHVGPLVGNSRGGQPHTIQLKDRYIVYVHLGFANGVLAQVQFIFSDGTKTPILGNRSKWKLEVVKTVGLGKDWQLACIHMVSGSGPSGTRGPAELVLDFMPFSGPENCSN